MSELMLARLFMPVVAVVMAVTAAAAGPDPVMDRARALHQRAVSIDSHTDAPLRWEKSAGRPGRGAAATLGAMKRGGLDARVVAAYVSSRDGASTARPLNRATYLRARRRVERLLDLIDAEAGANSAVCGVASTPAAIDSLKRIGKRALVPAVENGLCIGTDLDYIDTLASRGVIYVTLTHVYDNQLAHTSSRTRNPGGGLTPFGRKAVGRLNDAGVLIDLSHSSEATFHDVLALSRVPVVCTHSCCRALCDHDRNLTDAQMRALARAGGVVQIAAYKGFLRRGGRRASVDDVVRHIDHAVKVAGIDHVGVGTDFDGGGGVSGFTDDSGFVNVTAGLMRLGYSDEDIAKVMGGNFMRVLGEAQKGAVR